MIGRESGRLYNVSHIHNFPFVRNGTNKQGGRWYDDSGVALLELATDIHFDKMVQPVCLASNDHLLRQLDSRSRTDAWAVGWGEPASKAFWTSPALPKPEWGYKGDMTQMHMPRVRLAGGLDEGGYTAYIDKKQNFDNLPYFVNCEPTSRIYSQDDSML